VILPGDQIVIPDRRIRTEACQTDRTHPFRLLSPRTKLRLRLEDRRGQVLANKSYELVLDKATVEDFTSGDGTVEVDVPPGLVGAKLTVWLTEDKSGESCTWDLDIGHLDPVEEITGVQARLNNLGFDCGEIDGQLNEPTRRAMAQFRAAAGIGGDSVEDPTTQKKMLELHDNLAG
jgi:Putative peptidoglycan binding domain